MNYFVIQLHNDSMSRRSRVDSRSLPGAGIYRVMPDELTVEERVIVALRRITRSVDVHSLFLQRNFGLTGPQLTILRVIKRLQPVSTGEIAQTANFSPGTLTGILDRLEANGFVSRKRRAADRRTVLLRLTAAGDRILAEAPYLLRQRFLQEFDRMPAAEQANLLKTLEQLATLMETDSPIEEPARDARQPAQEKSDPPIGRNPKMFNRG